MEQAITEIEKLHIRQANKFIERIQPQWSAITQRFFLYCIAKVNKNNEHFEPLDIHMNELPQILGYSDKSKLVGTEVKTIFSELNAESNVQIIQDVGKGKRIFHSIFLFQEIYFNEKENRARILFSEPMRDHVLQLKEKKLGFTDFKYAEVINIKGSYSTRLIELLHQYKKIGKREFIYSDLRRYLGVSDEKYKDYRDFKKWILEQAKKEINKNPKSTIDVDFKGIKVGRFIGKIEFTIIARRQPSEQEKQDIKQQILLAEETVAATVMADEEINQLNPDDSIFLKIAQRNGVNILNKE